MGDVLRVRLRKKRLLKLKVRNHVGKAYDADEKARMIAVAKEAHSPHIYPALMIALNTGLRDAEMKNLTWAQVDLNERYLAVGRSKTEAGEGRTVPLNSALYQALVDYSAWYRERFGEIRPEWYVFPFGTPRPHDPTRPVTTLKTAWKNLRLKAKVQGRWHDNRHTLITELAENGAGDQTIMDIAGHQMLKHYSHIRMKAKRAALESILEKPSDSLVQVQDNSPVTTDAQRVEEGSLQKSLQSANFCGGKDRKTARKSLKRFGSSGRTRTYNPSVNSRIVARSPAKLRV
jgi:integrase